MRSGITSLDMSVLLDDTGVKEKEKKKLPSEKRDEEKDFVLFEEEEKEKEETKKLPSEKLDEDEFFVLFEEEDREDNQQSPGWGSALEGFGEFIGGIFAKPDSAATQMQAGKFGNGVKSKAGGNTGTTGGNGRYLPPLQRAAIQRSNNIYEHYKSLEEWLMSEGDDDLAKGIVNNLRSSIGGLVEDAAYWISDVAPWYEPAQKVVEDNTAGEIKDIAEKQFANAKETTGEVGDKVIDFADSASESLGYSLFGVSLGTYLEIAGAGFNEYQTLRESGYSEEEAFGMAVEMAMFEFLSTKVDDYIGKDSPVDDVLGWKEVPIDKIEDYAKIKPIWLNRTEYGHVMHELMTNITEEEKVRDFIWRPIGDYIYYFRKNTEGYYDIVDRVKIL